MWTLFTNSDSKLWLIGVDIPTYPYSLRELLWKILVQLY